MEGSSLPEEDVEMMENSDGKNTVTNEASPIMEPFIGMEFESEEAAKHFYENYAIGMGFVMRVDAFRRSMRDGTVVWRRLVCNKEGFRRLRPRRSENRKPRAITREGCKAFIVVKREKSGKWLVTKFVKEHNHPLLPLLPNGRRNSQLSQTPDEKDAKIRELSAELSRERRRCATLQQQLDKALKEMEEHSNHLSININNVIQSVREIESNTFTKSVRFAATREQPETDLNHINHRKHQEQTTHDRSNSRCHHSPSQNLNVNMSSENLINVFAVEKV